MLRRYVRNGLSTFLKPMHVVSDDETGLLLWMAEGTECAALIDEDGRTPHDLALNEMRAPRLVRRPWLHYDVLILMPPQAAYSVWWFFQSDVFSGWYVNLETPFRRNDDGVETTDQILDIVVQPDRTWEWKDEDEFAARTGNPLYFDEPAAAVIRAEGSRLTRLAESGAFPFDGTHTDFRPAPEWQALPLPPHI